MPAQLPIFVAAALGFWFLLQRTTLGRRFYAIGMSPEGARHAGIPVERRLALVYVLSGTVASLAALVYVAHLGQAKADAGTGYELLAITAVVLGGTSIFGGRGTIQGTVLGLFAIAVLQNGLRLAALPSELAGILTGAVLLVTITSERLSAKPAEPIRPSSEEFEVKNSQVAVLSGVILLAALIVAGSNWMLMRNYQPDRALTGKPERITVAMMPKSKGNAYFIACRKGAEEAAKELGVDLIWDGPTDPDPAKQNEIIDTWITRGVDVIAVAVENRMGISPVLAQGPGARHQGRHLGRRRRPGRPRFLRQPGDAAGDRPNPDGQGRPDPGRQGRVRDHHRLAHRRQHDRLAKEIEARLKEKYPDIKLAVVRPCDDMQNMAFDEANNILDAYTDVKLIMAICSPAVPGAAEAVKQAGPQRRQGDRPGPAQRQQTLCPRRHHRLHRPLEDR